LPSGSFNEEYSRPFATAPILNHMVKPRSVVLDHTFAALSDPTWRGILERLAGGPLATTSLAEPFALSLPAVIKHLRVLETAGLVVGERHGRERRYRLVSVPMKEASSWFDLYRAFWDERLDALSQYLEESNR